MRRLIMITGDLACGKSTFAQILSKRYGIVMLHKDKIKEILADTIGFSDREENRRLSVAAVALMTYQFLLATQYGQDVILEANFKEGESEELFNIAKKAGYELLTLKLTADINLIYKRFVDRIEKENRHPAHISGFDGFESLKYYIEIGRMQKTFGRTIEISADDFSYQTDAELLSKIDEFMGQK